MTEERYLEIAAILDNNPKYCGDVFWMDHGQAIAQELFNELSLLREITEAAYGDAIPHSKSPTDMIKFLYEQLKRK